MLDMSNPWELVKETTQYQYFQNKRNGKRYSKPKFVGGYTGDKLDEQWLNGGDWTPVIRPNLPNCGSGAMRPSR